MEEIVLSEEECTQLNLDEAQTIWKLLRFKDLSVPELQWAVEEPIAITWADYISLEGVISICGEEVKLENLAMYTKLKNEV